MFSSLKKNILKIANMSQILSVSIIILLFIIIIILLVNSDTFINTGFRLPSLEDDSPDIQSLTLPISFNTMSKPISNSENVEPVISSDGLPN